MKLLSVFDIIGPNMIGPSSSHTAGALRIARVAYKLAPKHLKNVTFVLYGSFAKTYRGHGTDRALVAGLLGMGEEDERIKEAFKYAEEAGLSYQFEISDDIHYAHPNTVEIIMQDREGNHFSVTGASIGGGSISVDKINGMEIFFNGEYDTLLVAHQDKTGVISSMTQVLAKWKINIAYMRVYREGKGRRAYTIIEADEPISEGIIGEVEAIEAVSYAKIIDI